MRNIYTLSARKTFKYNEGYKDLDKWLDIGTFSYLSSKAYETNGQWSFDAVCRIRIDSKADKRTIEDAIYYQFPKGCQCEHDCCGHFFSYVTDAKHIRRKEWVVKMHWTRNI